MQVLQGHFTQLKQRLLDSKPEDFGLDKDCDWNVASPQGTLHQAQAALLLGCLEVVVEDVIAEATGSSVNPFLSISSDEHLRQGAQTL